MGWVSQVTLSLDVWASLPRAGPMDPQAQPLGTCGQKGS